MPTTNLTGWTLAFSDDFSGSSLHYPSWFKYGGTLWDGSHVVVENGLLELQSYRDPKFNNTWKSGGVSTIQGYGSNSTYGKYLVRQRVDPGYGIAAIALLWPSDNSWPPEIDFYEDGGGSVFDNATFHFTSKNNQTTQYLRNVNFTQWHTMGVEWTPGKLVYTIDDQVWGTVQSNYVPNISMGLALQTQAGTTSSNWNPIPNNSTPSMVQMQVDWVVIYAWNPQQTS
ncbi:unnamed protein product [Rotaria sp. Silwood1]|nr:unnamed protein product [Rotaria sp. Silwood1]CAF1651075.1 unnamed protein product [Rotaria sp. Silwood1]CAF3872297.1 unnamed protein product [Rotaria sp. Silwood1]CAF4899355.1 unnamed protein product [Rotaria sp. Silwood1]